MFNLSCGNVVAREEKPRRVKMDTLHSILVPSARMVLAQVGLFVSSMLLFLVLVLIGWLISKYVIKIGVTKLLKVLKLDELSHRIDLDVILAKGGINNGLAELIGIICYWLALLVTFVVALNAVGLAVAADLLQKIVLFVPNIIAALFILIVGMFAAVLVRNLVRVSANNAGISQSNLVSNICEVVIIVFAVAIALDQLQIGVRIIDLTISIILGSFGLGFALAFGLGCKDIVGKAVGDFLSKLKK
jgi:small-conductance mechanosensitive channel